MDNRTNVSKFWEDNYCIEKDTKDLNCPTPEEVFSHFQKTSQARHLSLDSFKVSFSFNSFIIV
jgi:hypothetical protein